MIFLIVKFFLYFVFIIKDRKISIPQAYSDQPKRLNLRKEREIQKEEQNELEKPDLRTNDKSKDLKSDIENLAEIRTQRKRGLSDTWERLEFYLKKQNMTREKKEIEIQKKDNVVRFFFCLVDY